MSVGKKETDFPEVSFGDYWIRKMRTLFRKLDHSGNGYITLDDLLEVAAELMASFPKLESYKGDDLIKSIVDLWFGYLAVNEDEHHRTEYRLRSTQFLENMKQITNSSLKENFHSIFIAPFFNSADMDSDSKITKTEHRMLMRAWKTAEKESDTLFQMLDTDRDGKITMDEFHCAWAEYFYSEDPKSKIKLFGDLVNYKRPEDFGEIGCGPYWEGKMRTMFRRLDVSGNQKLTCQDFIQIARGIIQRGHLDKKKADAVMRTMLNIWVKFIAVDKEGRHKSEINEKEFIHNFRAMINSEFRHEIDQFGWTFFKAVETAGNGYINQQEFRNFHEAWRVSREEAAGIFGVIDADKDGQISHDEYLTAWIDYFLGEDQSSPYKTFFGCVKSNF